MNKLTQELIAKKFGEFNAKEVEGKRLIKETISLHDHRIENIYIDDGYIIDCSCGKSFKGYKGALDNFTTHQKDELNKQLEEINADVEVE